MIDLADVQAFLAIAEQRNFTRAAEILGTTQPLVSARLKRLETATGRRLVERHPRMVRLSAEGEAFLPAARDLMAAHARALGQPDTGQSRLRIGISEHVVGRGLPDMIAILGMSSPQLRLEVQLGLSAALIGEFDAGVLDAVIIRSDSSRREGEFLRQDIFGWYASPEWTWRADAPLPLVTLSQECNIRAVAAKALDNAGIAHADSFLGGGVSAVCAAITAGLGVAPLAARVAPLRTLEVGARLGLPPLPTSRVMLHSNTQDQAALSALRRLAALLRGQAE
jgi:DNA-binding transcriptional LysR family regulator